MINNNINLLKISILVIVFRLLLDYGYWKFVYSLYEYSGFTFHPSAKKIVISWILTLLLLYIINIKRKSALIYVYFLVYAISILPIISYYAMSGEGVTSFWMSTMTYLLFVLFLSNPNKINFSLNSKINQKQKLIIFSTILLCIINLFYLIYSTGGRFIISFADVYDFRADNLTSYSGVFGYLNNWSTKILIPFLIAISLVNKSRLMFISTVLLCAFFYIFTGHKSILLPIILGLFLYKALQAGSHEENFNRFSSYCLIGLIMFSVTGVMLFFWKQEVVFASIFFRRTFFVPAFLNDIYFDMFQSIYQPVYWSNSFLSSILPYPYGNEPVTKVVGSYLNSPDTGANTGFIASGFMQARYWGVAFYVLLVVLINFYLSKIAHRVHPLVFNGVLLIPFLTIFSSTDLLTGLLTHGLIVSIVILYLYSGILKVRNQ